jgi:hypothetical protein
MNEAVRMAIQLGIRFSKRRYTVSGPGAGKNISTQKKREDRRLEKFT